MTDADGSVLSPRESATDDELAARALRQAVADLIDRLHDAIEAGLDVDTLHDIAGLWEANNLNDDLTYERLVRAGQPTVCDDCSIEVTPYDEDGRPTEDAWELYMVQSEVWEAAGRSRGEAEYLCIGCLEERIGRRLTPEDFSDVPLNDPGGLSTARLRDRQGHP